MVKRMILKALLLAVILLSIGCRTIEGIGRDIEWIGQKGAEAVE